MKFTKNIIEYKSIKTGELVYKIDKEKLKGEYFVNNECDFHNLCSNIILNGFKKLPKGFSTDGYGFASPASSYLKNELLETFGNNIKIELNTNGKSSARKLKNQYKIIFNHDDYLVILEKLRTIRAERNLKSNEAVANFLSEIFPKYYKRGKKIKTIYTYEKDKLTKIINKNPDILKELSKADIDTIVDIFSKLEKQKTKEFSKISIQNQSRKRNERVYLQTVLKEFDNRLKKYNDSESKWQSFLQKYILLFNTSYIKSIEKLNIDLRGKYPDFLLVNVFGYLDIFEIKKPTTNLLKHDDSRDNYFWDTELSKAISQTEKYIQMLTKKELDVKDIIKEKHKIDVKIIRPRGYIVAGTSKQLKNKKMEDDFRLLSVSLKNVDIILYDEFKNSLKNLLARLK